MIPLKGPGASRITIEFPPRLSITIAEDGSFAGISGGASPAFHRLPITIGARASPLANATSTSSPSFTIAMTVMQVQGQAADMIMLMDALMSPVC
jgi:hypothetical protein